MNTKLSNPKTLQLHTKVTRLFYGIFAAALLLRLYMAATSTGFLSDISCFASWALRVYKGGFAEFYSPDVFTDYPPGYIYVLYPIGALLHHTQMNVFSGPGLVLLKLPSILCDMIAGGLIFFLGCKKGSPRTALVISALYLLNPAVLLNSVVWGQVDSILALLVVLLCLLLQKGRVVPACFVFAAGLLLKPQMLIFAPLLLYGIYEYELRSFPGWRHFLRDALGGICALLCFLLALLPFGIQKVIPQYTDTLASYAYASVNAYNIWALFGLNWQSQEGLFLGISYQQIGSACIVLLTVISAVIFEMLRRRGREDRYFLTGAFIIGTTFLLSVRMHERYLYPAMLLLVFTYVFGRQRAFVGCCLLLSAAHFLNVWHVLYYYDPMNFSPRDPATIVLSAFLTISMIVFYVVICCSLQNRLAQKDDLWDWSRLARVWGPCEPDASRKSVAIDKVDLILMAAVTLLYGAVAFIGLGCNKAPETEYPFSVQGTVTLKFAPEETPEMLCYYLRTESGITCALQQSADGTQWSQAQTFSMKNVFTWGQVTLSPGQVYLTLTNQSEDALLGELIFLDGDGRVVTPLNASVYPQLFDEPETLPETFDYRSSAYFDEIYYFRTANEFLTEQPAYEMTHPPLGKILMAFGALLFGTNPFGFRFMGTLLGVLMLPLLYLLARGLTASKVVSTMVTFCFAFDFMHFTQTRLATIDGFTVFFIIVMYLFMERYLRLSFYDTALYKTFLPLGACGVAFGLGISCKWSSFYAGAGLAVLFFLSLHRRWREYRYACLTPGGSTKGIKHRQIIENFLPNTKKTIGFCLLFFVAVPILIYTLSYIPFRDYSQDGLLTRMWNNQLNMYHYHSTLNATHAYSSLWYEWPTMIRPVFYYASDLGNGLYQGISAFGNPAVWYACIPAALYTFYLALRKRTPAAVFLSVGLLAQLLPWVFVTRCTFLYHYFPSIPFLVLMLGYTGVQLKKRMRPGGFYSLCAIYCLAVLVLFVMFYPVISGMPVSGEYVDKYLRWMDSWVLILN